MNKKILSQFWMAVRKYKSEFVLIIALSLVHSALKLVMLIISRKLFISPSFEYFLCGIILLILIMFFTNLINIGFHIASDTFAGAYLNEILLKAQKHINQAYLSDIEEIGIERIQHILYSDALDMFRIIGHHIPLLIASFFILVFSLGISMVYDIKTTLFLLFSFISGVMLSFYSKKRIMKASSNTNSKIKIFNETLLHYTGSIETVKANRFFDFYKNRIKNDINSFISDSKVEDREIYFFQGLISNYNLFIQIILSTFLSIPLYNHSTVNLAFYMILFFLIMNQGELVENLLQQISKSSVCFENMNIIFSIKNQSGEKTLKKVESIEFKNLSFTYPKRQEEVLSNVNLSFFVGDLVGITGKNGSGKSTFFKLMLRFYPPDTGKILLNGTPIEEYDFDSLYSNFLYIGQEEMLIDGDIEEYKREIIKNNCGNDKEILMNVGDLGEKFENMGKNLSVGQRKKILFSKLQLLYENSDVIMIDELDSGLDIESQKIFEDWINNLKRDKIIFVVQHKENSGINFTKKLNL